MGWILACYLKFPKSYNLILPEASTAGFALSIHDGYRDINLETLPNANDICINCLKPENYLKTSNFNPLI